MKIGLIGYGSTGKVIEKEAVARNIVIAGIYTEQNILTVENGGEADVFVDFSAASGVVGNVSVAACLGKPIVIGTTGWNDRLSEVQTLVAGSGIGCVFGSNFSIGANLFFQVIAAAARQIDTTGLFDVGIIESHHRNKSDSPSGTALSLANLVISSGITKKSIVAGNNHDVLDSNELHISSLRVGTVFGEHSVIFDSDNDTIELKHTAKSRAGFALGALLAAQWITGRPGMFSFSEQFIEITANLSFNQPTSR